MNEFLILFILNKQKSNIYEIKKYIDTNFAPFLEVSVGAIIPALKRLEKTNCVISEKLITDGGLKRTIYSITEQGISRINSYLEEEIACAPQLARREIEVLMALLFDESFDKEQQKLLAKKIKNAINNNIKQIQNAIKYSKMNPEFLNMELIYMEAKNRTLHIEEN